MIVLGLAVGLARPALASHLLGGEMTYRYLDNTGPAAAPHRYEITVAVYNNCASSVLDSDAPVAIYDKATGAQVALTATNYAGTITLVGYTTGGVAYLPQVSLDACTTPVVPAGCTITGNSQAYRLQKFVGVINLPASSQGFYAFWSAYARNAGIANVQYSSSQYMALYTTLAPPVLANSSPIFVDKAVANLCVNDTTFILNNAVDPDGDQLVYSFGQPYGQDYLASFATPALVPYAAAPYTAATPLGTAAGTYAGLNAATGIAKFRATSALNDKFVVAIDVQEYRLLNGVSTLIGTTRRDVQLVVVSCPNTVAPIHPTSAPVAPTPRAFTIEAGSTLTIPLTATQANGHPLTMLANSVLLDGAGGYDATFGGSAGTLLVGNPAGVASVASPTSPVSSTFVYTPACAEVRAAPYDLTITVKDEGCAGKTVGDVLRITVVKPTGPTAIAGSGAVCGLGTQQTYTASGGTVANLVWTVTGGTIVGSATANPVTVSWPTAGTGTVSAQGVTPNGCLVDLVSKSVTISPAATLTVGGSQAICQGGSTTLTVAGGTAPYTVTGGPAPVSGAGPFVLSPTQTTTYTVAGTASGSACAATRQVTITVSPVPAANAGPAVTTCAGSPAQLGSAPVAGSTYSWNPATGLSSPTVANPTVTLANPTGALLTQTYTLTETNAASGCQASKSVTVTVAPPPVAAPGAPVAICSGGTGQLGAAALPGYTYSWSPGTGLSNSTVANPTVTLTNPTGAPTVQTYTLTVSAAGSCSSTGMVAVTVNPKPTADAGAAVAFCSGGSGQLGAAPVAGLTYSWNPSAGLSSSTVANPTVTLTNNTATATTQTYTLTVTGAGGCPATGTVAVTVQPSPTADAGAAVAFCTGGSAQLGAAPVAGLTYSWSPATGLSSSTVANPTVTLTNTTGAPVTQTYTLTATNAGGCTSTGTVAVTVNPFLTATPGAAVAFCSGGTGQLGAAAVTGYSYSWSPATGLSSATAANPTVTLTNPTGAPITQTYTLTATNASGCTSTSTVLVTVYPQSAANAGAAVAFCSGSSAQLGSAPVAGYAYSWSPATGLSSSTVANPSVTLTNASGAPVTQTYTLTVTNASGCTSTGTVAATVAPLPVAAAGPAVAICSGGTGQLGAAALPGLTYSWSPATGLSSSTVANPAVTLTNATGAPLTQTYTLTVSAAGSCSSTSTVAVTVNPKPIASAGLPISLCAGSTGQLGAAPVAGYTYSWNPATGLSSATAANPTVTLTNATGTPTVQAYTLTATNTATGCASTGTVAVTVQPLTVATPGVAVVICSGGTGQLGAAALPGYTYSWSPATGLSSSLVANPTLSLTNTTGAPITQTYTLTVASPGGCTSTGTVAVTVNPKPTADAGAAVAFCSGGSGQLGAAPVAGLTYSWNPSAGLSSSTVANPTVTLTNAAGAPLTQTYALTVTNASGCTSTSPVLVTVNPLPVAAVGPAVAICSGGTGQLGAAPAAGVAYSWSPATGLSSPTVANPAISLTTTTGTPITQTYTLTATNPATGCVSTGTVAVTVSPLPTATPGAPVAMCSGAMAQLGAAPVAGLTYSWSPGTGLSNPAAANPTVTLTNATPATLTQTYTLTVTNASGCASTGTVAVTVTPAVVAGTIGAGQTVCAGSVPAPLASLAAASGGPGTYVYQWEQSTDSVTWKAVANVTSLSYAPSAVATTTHFRRRVVAGACGLFYTNVVTVRAQRLLIPTVALPAPPPQCVGSALTFTPVPANAGAAPTYQWFINGAPIGAGPAFTSAALADGDVVQVLLTSTPGFCATGTALGTVRVSFTPVPPPTLTIKLRTALPVCQGAPVSFSLDQATSIGPNPQYQWQVDGVAVRGATSPVFTSTTLRHGQAVALVLRTTNACGQPATVASSAVAVQVNPPVHVSAGPDQTIVEGESVVLQGTADGSYPVGWTPAQSLTFAGGDQLHPVAAPLTTTTYVLSAGAGYCADQSAVTVTVLRRVRIPSAFTPNADNHDDTWQIGGIEDYPANHVEVFSRWGQKLFEAAGYGRSTEWDGTYKGEPLPFGTYYYLVTLGNGKSYTGPLTVLR